MFLFYQIITDAERHGDCCYPQQDWTRQILDIKNDDLAGYRDDGNGNDDLGMVCRLRCDCIDQLRLLSSLSISTTSTTSDEATIIRSHSVAVSGTVRNTHCSGGE